MTTRGPPSGDKDSRCDAAAARPIEQDPLAAIAAAAFSERRARVGRLGFGTLSEPAWDILLALYVEKHRHNCAPLAHLIGTSCTAPTTSLRLLRVLVDDGFARVLPRGSDGETCITLSKRGIDEIEHHLRTRLDALVPESATKE